MDSFKMFSRTAVGTGQCVNVGAYLREAISLLCSLFATLPGGEDSEVKLGPPVATGGPSRPLNIECKMSRVLDPVMLILLPRRGSSLPPFLMLCAVFLHALCICVHQLLCQRSLLSSRCKGKTCLGDGLLTVIIIKSNKTTKLRMQKLRCIRTEAACVRVNKDDP